MLKPDITVIDACLDCIDRFKLIFNDELTKACKNILANKRRIACVVFKQFVYACSVLI